MYVIEKRGDWSPLMGRSGSYAVYGTKTTAEAVVKTLSPQEMYRVAKYIHKPGDPYASRPKVNVKAWYPDGRVEKYHFWDDVDWDRLRRETIGDGAIAAYVSSMGRLRCPIVAGNFAANDEACVLMVDPRIAITPFASMFKPIRRNFSASVRLAASDKSAYFYIFNNKCAVDQFNYEFMAHVALDKSVTTQSTPKSAHKPGDIYCPDITDKWEYAGELRVPKLGEWYEPTDIARGEICRQTSGIPTQTKPREILRPRKVGRDDNW